MRTYDVIVIGGGHAGTEAAALAARSGARTLMVTQTLETIGQMSCNPAIGGIAKGTVVREVDALGGIMGRATDMARVQFRMLNRSKGPAVWSPRAQCDRGLYRRAVRLLLERLPNLSFVQGTAKRLLLNGTAAVGLETMDGCSFGARAIVVTAGTFLRGMIHSGLAAGMPAGRLGDAPSVELAESIAELGLTVERFKTGTPPRIDGRTASLATMRRQDGEEKPFWFSFYERHEHPAQLPCYLTHTGEALKAIITEHLQESALYGGAISGRGPRYCPSIEDKIVRFPHASRHQVFLEPEGLDTHEMYVNGLSTSLPPDVQVTYLRSVPGLEQVEMTRPGYAIEYDFFPPTQLDHRLKVKSLEGLYFAGQINGTTGYEEAAAQGVVAGLNAAAKALGKEPFTLRRDESFIGVLVDDLVTRGVDEPYRLFTSRAEFRLLLRQDNALRRLFPLAVRQGVLSDDERREAEGQLEAEERVMELALGTVVRPDAVNPLLEAGQQAPIQHPMRASDLARRHGLSLPKLLESGGVRVEPRHADWAEIEFRYEGYLARELQVAQRLAAMDEFVLPMTMDYLALNSISYEGREKLQRIRPESLGQAGRIPGVSPSDLQNLVMEVTRARGR